MRNIIIYDTRYGTTKKIVNLIAKNIRAKGEQVEVVNVKCIHDYNLNFFDRIILGGSIYAGTIKKSIKLFSEKNSDLLKSKELGLFIVCMEEKAEKREEQLKNAFSDDLRVSSKAVGILGGEFLFNKMNFFEKLMVRLIAKTKKSKSKVDRVAIDVFVDKLLK